jgi:predicted DNA binding CopG/RHH family protein
MQNVMVNIRLFSEDLLEYRLMALEEGKSLSTYIRDIIRMYADSKKQRKFRSAFRERLPDP